MSQDPITQLMEFFKNIHGKLSTKKKRKVAKRLLEAFQDHQGEIKAWEMGNDVIPKITQETGVSQVYAYKVLGELIDLGIIAKTLTGYELSPIFRKRVYRLYKALREI